MPKSILARLTSLAKISALAAIVTLAAGGASAKENPENSIEIITQTGTFVGAIEDGTIAHKGIPYAKAPVAELRWRLPQPLAVSSASYDATRYKPHCPQENAPDDPDAEEDCLFLNVFAPKLGKPNGNLRPVMVWIHGGANAFGASDFYHPHNLVLTGEVVVVTLNCPRSARGRRREQVLTNIAPDLMHEERRSHALSDSRASRRYAGKMRRVRTTVENESRRRIESAGLFGNHLCWVKWAI
ncbi:hypothetical protein B0E33_18595 [Roseibium algicola]|uniref:Carboxylesterase type B domain-containing protein n=1 Tax=Roseibium algicola TaxID=2857014 RepID=A0ABM6I4L7_9HYPH|nr:hypothetical protein B0E33_18595 [Roseibium aggregatum]